MIMKKLVFLSLILSSILLTSFVKAEASPVKLVMLTTHVDVINSGNIQNFRDIADNSNMVKYNYLFQDFDDWGRYCEGLSESKLKNMISFWSDYGYTTGFYIDVGEARKSIAKQYYIDSILQEDWANWGYDNASRMSIKPGKSWYIYLKNCALSLVNTYGLTAFNIDRSDVVGVAGTHGNENTAIPCSNGIDDDGDGLIDENDGDCQDLFLRYWLDDVRSSALSSYGINVKFVGNSFQDWQTETVKRFWFIGTDGAPAANGRETDLNNWINQYRNLAQYTERKIFYIAPWLQNETILNDHTLALLAEHYKNILARHNFTFFDDWTILDLINKQPQVLCILNTQTNCEGIAPGSSWCDGNNKKSCNSACSFSTQTCQNNVFYDSDPSNNHQIFGTCTEYRGCSAGNCVSTSLSDACQDSYNVRESAIAFNSYCALQNPYNCRNLGSDYICSGGKCTPPSYRCPILNAWNGTDYKEIELLNIHAPEDTTYTSSFSMQSKDGKYELLLHEAAYKFWDGSHIDSVKLTDSSGNDCRLLSAVHSKQGDVLQDLLYSDDKRARTYPEDEIKLVYDGCSGTDFSFTVEGYNRKCGPYECGYFIFGYPLILITPVISFVFILLVVALYLLILSLLEKYKII